MQTSRLYSWAMLLYCYFRISVLWIYVISINKLQPTANEGWNKSRKCESDKTTVKTLKPRLHTIIIHTHTRAFIHWGDGRSLFIRSKIKLLCSPFSYYTMYMLSSKHTRAIPTIVYVLKLLCYFQIETIIKKMFGFNTNDLNVKSDISWAQGWKKRSNDHDVGKKTMN